MPVILMFRYSRENNLFNHYLNRIIKSPDGNSLLLCSGFWEEGTYDNGFKQDPFYLSTTELLDSIKEGCEGGKVITVGPGRSTYNNKEQKRWMESYKAFVEMLRCEDKKFKEQKRKGFEIESYIPRAGKEHWHAKIAIRLRGDKPIIALIGSSNLTRRAYEDQSAYDDYNWNHESDALIFLSSSRLKEYFDPSKRRIQPGDPIYLTLDPEMSQPSEEEQMDYLYKAIKSKLGDFESI